jgi:hypothetical protein
MRAGDISIPFTDKHASAALPSDAPPDLTKSGGQVHEERAPGRIFAHFGRYGGGDRLKAELQ